MAIKLIRIMIGVAVVMIIAGAVFYRSFPEGLYFAFGVILTTTLNAIKLVWMERSAERIANADAEHAGLYRGYFGGQFLLRYILTFAILIAAAFIPFIDLIGAALGLLTLQLSLYVYRFITWRHGKPLVE